MILLSAAAVGLLTVFAPGPFSPGGSALAQELPTDDPLVNFRVVYYSHSFVSLFWGIPRDRGITRHVLQRYEHNGNEFISSGTDHRIESPDGDIEGLSATFGDTEVEPNTLYRYELTFTNSSGTVIIVTSVTVRTSPEPGQVSTDATLSGLTLSGVDMDPSDRTFISDRFFSQVISYVGSAANDVTETTVTPTVNHSGASYVIKLNGGIDADGVIPLAVGSNTITVEVTAEDGSTSRTYTVSYTIPHSLTKVSGDEQEGPANTQLAESFVVLVSDEDGAAIAGVVVSFSVTAGGGMLSATTDANPCTIESSTSSTTATTDANGHAAIRLTLGSEPGTNTVEATVAGESETFTATAAEQAMPHSLENVCGDDQEGTAGVLLAEPFVVLVSDEDGAAIAGVVVSFSVTAGGGTLSSTTATTDVNGRARTWLTLGSELGTNSVEATVEGLVPVTFTATGQKSPLASLFDVFLSGSGKLVALPDSPQLAQNAPNPFNSQTVLSYFLPAAGPVRLDVFTLTGQRVAVLHQGPQQAGYHRLHWDGRDNTGRSLASGTYLYRLMTDETVLTRKLTLLR